MQATSDLHFVLVDSRVAAMARLVSDVNGKSVSANLADAERRLKEFNEAYGYKDWPFVPKYERVINRDGKRLV